MGMGMGLWKEGKVEGVCFFFVFWVLNYLQYSLYRRFDIFYFI